jgi:hypothetical protein
LNNLVEAVFGILSEGVKGRSPKLTHTPRSVMLWLRKSVAIHALYIFMVQNLSRHRGEYVGSCYGETLVGLGNRHGLSNVSPHLFNCSCSCICICCSCNRICIVFILCSVSVITCVVLCAVFCLSVVCYLCVVS